MKVLFISYNGALEPLLQSQGISYLKGLSRKGVKCVLLSFEKPFKKKDVFKNKIGLMKKELRDSGIDWYWLRYHKYPTLPATLFDVFMGVLLSVYLVIVKRIDIIHARSTVPAAMGYLASRLTAKKFIFDERGLMAEEYVDGGMWKRGGFLYRVVLCFEKKLLVTADALVVLSENIRAFLTDTAYLTWGSSGKRKNITVIPCCVDIQKFNIQPSLTKRLSKKFGLSGKFVFLYTGSFGTWYLLDEMIDFFSCAKTIIPQAHFLILTRLPKNTVTELWVKKGFLNKDLTVASVEFTDMPDYIKLANVGMFFIKPTFSKTSSCPTKFAEYLACGLPVVINSGIGDTDSIVRDNNVGVVVESFDGETYLSAAVKIQGMVKEEKDIATRCYSVARDTFSLENGIEKYWQIYNKVMDKRI